jgi:hypothetical protein
MPIVRRTLRLQGTVGGSVEMFERMNGTIESLDIRPVIDRGFELHDIVPGLEYLESGQYIDKIIVRVSDR